MNAIVRSNGVGLWAWVATLCLFSTPALALDICGLPGGCDPDPGPVLSYQLVSGEIGFTDAGASAASGFMQIQRTTEIFSDPVAFDVLALSIDADNISLHGTGEVDASLRGGVGFGRNLSVPNGGLSFPPPPSGNYPVNFVYGFEAESLEAPAGIERFRGLYFSMTDAASNQWEGGSRSEPEHLALDLILREFEWQLEGTALSFLSDEAVGSATLQFALVPAPEPGTALLLGIGLVGLGARRR